MIAFTQDMKVTPWPNMPPTREQKAEARLRLDAAKKVGRNQPCPCNSGKKFKRCCGQ